MLDFPAEIRHFAEAFVTLQAERHRADYALDGNPFYPGGLTGLSFVLDEHGRHRWWPVAPCAHVEVRLERPAVAWSGPAYLDINAGDESLEDAFARWNWSRAHLRGGRTAILYDVEHRDGVRRDIALEVGEDGEARRFDPPPVAALRPTPIWRMPRETRAGMRDRASVARTLEDTPFYSRSVLDGRLRDEPVVMVHESVSTRRFERRWVGAGAAALPGAAAGGVSLGSVCRWRLSVSRRVAVWVGGAGHGGVRGRGPAYAAARN